MSYLEIDHVAKVFPAPEGGGEVCVFRDVHFAIEQGEFVTMVGHSGCGKSTLLNIIAGLEHPSAGGVVLEGREIRFGVFAADAAEGAKPVAELVLDTAHRRMVERGDAAEQR